MLTAEVIKARTARLDANLERRDIPSLEGILDYIHQREARGGFPSEDAAKFVRYTKLKVIGEILAKEMQESLAARMNKGWLRFFRR